jgi:PAS domain S-box-containing protein
MEDERKTKKELIDELAALRQRITELEKSENIRKQAEKALNESEAKFRALAENATAAIFVIQREKYVYINPSFTNMTGYSFEDLSSTKFWDFIAPDMRDLVRTRGIGRQNKEDVPSRYDLRFITKSGEEHSGSFCATLIEFQNAPAILGTVLDITECKDMEIALHASEEKYRELVENANSIILRMDVTGKINFFNEFAQRFFGYEEEEILGENVVGTIVPPYESTGRDLHIMIQDIGLNPKSYANNINENIRRNGERVWIAWTNRPVYGKSGKLSEIMCVGNDITESKKAEDLLRLAEEKYRNIFENSIMGIFQTTPEGRYLKANRELAWMLGHESPEEMIALVTDIGQQQYVHPEDRIRLKELYKCLGVVHRFETEMYRKDGARMWISLNGRVVKGEEDKTLYYEGTIEDITRRKQAETALRESESKFRDFTEKSLAGVYLLHGDGTVKYVNARCAEIFKYKVEEVIDILNVKEVIFSEDWPIVKESMRKRMSGELPSHHYEFRIVTKNKDMRYVEAYSSITMYKGKPAVLGTILDITERKQAEEALKESERRYRELINLLPLTVAEFNKDGYVTLINHYGMEKYGITWEDIDRGLKGFQGVIPEEQERAKLISEGALKGERIEGREFTAVKKDGSTFPVLTYFCPISRNGDHQGCLAITIDITEHKQLEEQLHHAQKMQSIGTLAGGIAHDFNNLLTTILGCGQLLKLKVDCCGKAGAYLDRIMEAAESAAQLTQNLLTFGRKHSAKPIVVDPNMMVDKIEKMAKRTIGENIALKVIYGLSNSRIMADVNQMEQVLLNIIINARDAMPEGGELTIRTENAQLNEDFTEQHGGGGKPGKYAKISIQDSGIGMDGKTMDRIFEPFFTTKEVGKGTGLGLSIVYGIIRKHNGYVTVSSEPGRGTKVDVYLPFTDAASETSTVASDLVNLEKGNETILIAEDDPLMLNMLKAILIEGGYGIIEAVDGEDALQKYLQYKEKIEMVILDVMMPKKNAKDVFEVIKVMDPFQKILFISGYTPEDIDKSGIFKENFNLIKKPFLPDYLLKKVREVFAG